MEVCRTVKRMIYASCLLGVALFFSACSNEGPGGPSSPTMTSPTAVASGLPTGSPATKGPATGSPATKGPATASPGPAGPVSGSPAAQPAAKDIAIEPKPKTLPATGQQDPAGIVRIYVLEDGTVKPESASAASGKQVNLLFNNYGAKDAAIEISGGTVSQKATAGASQKVVVNVPAAQAGEYKIAIGSTSVKLTVK
jgi:hypothetical protein